MVSFTIFGYGLLIIGIGECTLGYIYWLFNKSLSNSLGFGYGNFYWDVYSFYGNWLGFLEVTFP